MNGKTSTFIIVGAFGFPALIGVIRNQLDPSYATALDVPFMAVLGLVLGVLGTAVFVLI